MAVEPPRKRCSPSWARLIAKVYQVDPLVYGFPGRPRDGLWGVRVRLDAEGRPVGPAESFQRDLPASAPELLGRLWRGALGLS